MYDRELTDTEVAEYKDRFVKFFSLLVEIDQRCKRGGKENEQPNKQIS